MIELLIFAAGAATGVVAMLLPYFTAKRDRSLALTDLSTERQVSKALDNRVITLRGDNVALQADVKRLGSENVELQREAGRYAAELRAANQRLAKFERPRGAKGKFAKKEPNLKLHVASDAEREAIKTKPISCG